MPGTDPGLTWQEGLAAFGVIAVVAFLVTWVLTDVLEVPRTPYIAMLFVVALGLGAGYCAWSGTSADELFTGASCGRSCGPACRWVPLVRRLPAHPRPERSRGLMLWEGLVYASRRPCCLPPVLAVWRACDAGLGERRLGWSAPRHGDRGSLVDPGNTKTGGSARSGGRPVGPGGLWRAGGRVLASANAARSWPASCSMVSC
jgi:hypothetical protein